MGHSFDMLTFDFLLKPPQPVTGLFFCLGIQRYLLQVKISFWTHISHFPPSYEAD